ncbi:hypothetical protein Aduo_011760 [Ancylostoma duodenale]
MSEFTEEQLLGTSPPRDDYMEQDSEHDGSNVSTDPKVSTMPDKAKECLIQCVHKALTTIGIECEKVLSKAFRTTNPIRNEIMEVVTRQIKVSNEMILNACDQIGEGGQDPVESGIEEGVIEILKVANLTRVDELEICLDDRLRDKETIQRLCDAIRCEKGELEKRVREMVNKLEENESTLASMQEYVKKQDVQVQELTKKITMLGHSGSQPDVESRGGEEIHNRWDKWQRFADVSKIAENVNEPVLQDIPVSMTCKHGMHTYYSQLRNRSSERTKAAATCTWGTVSGAFQATNGLFGQKSVTDIGIMGKKVQALLDTGSEMSIVPLSVFRTARAKGIDLDEYVERVPKIDAVIRNASGTIMNFADTIRMDVTRRNRTKPVAFHIGKGFGDVVILGTNALETFGIRLSMDMDGEVPKVDRPQKVAVVKERIFIPSGSTKTVTLEGDVVRGDYLLCATHPLVEDSLCSVTEDGIANVTVCNDSGEHRVLHKGEVIGEWFRDGWMPVNVLADGADMMEKITENEVEGKERLQELLDVLKERTPMTEELKRMIGSYSDTEPEVTIVIYNELHDVPAELSAACGARTCIFVTPTSEKPYDKAEWCALGMAFTNIVRGGVKLIAISGPRGESAWSQNRKDATDMLEVVRDASAAMRSNVVTTFSSVPSRERAASSTYAPIRNFSHSFSGARGCGARRGHRGRFDSIRGSFRGGFDVRY